MKNWQTRWFHHSALFLLHWLGRVNVNQVNAGVGQLGELFQIVAAINDAGVEEGRGFTARGRDALLRVLADRQVSPTFGSGFLGHAFSVEKIEMGVNARSAGFTD